MVYNMEMVFFAILNLKHHASASMQCINALTFCKESHKSVQTYLSLTNHSAICLVIGLLALTSE